MDIPNVPGLDFHPTDDELLTYYLKQRILDYFQDPSRSVHSHTIPDIDLYSMHPKELPRHFKRLVHVKSNGREWVFFCARKEKYRNSSRSERTVHHIGYWKVTSKPKEVKSEAGGNVIGSKNILTFYEGRHLKGIKTDWILHEYHDITEMPFVVCRLYYKGRTLDESTCEDESTGLNHEVGNFAGRVEYFHGDGSGSSSGGFYNGNDSNLHYPSNNGGAVSSSFGGYYDNGNGSNSYYPSNDEPSYYQQYQGDWNSHYY